MFYLGIDQHARQLTISLRNEEGDVLEARQVSTEPKKVNAFFARLTRETAGSGESFVTVLEVCGFNDWLLRMLKDYRCRKVILIQPEERKKRKTDRRDAAALSELLWVNRARLLAGKPVRGLRQVDVSVAMDQENRRLTMLRREAGQAQTRIINKIKHILRRHNLQWEMPTKTFPTRMAIAWLKGLVFPEIDRLELDHLLADLEHVQGRMMQLEQVLSRRCDSSETAMLLATTPGVGRFTATARSLSHRSRRALPACAKPGQLLGAHPRLPQQRRVRPAAGPDHQGRQRHGPLAAGPIGLQSVAQGSGVARMVQAD